MDEETQRQLKVRDDLIISLERENLLREDAGYLGVGVWQDVGGTLYWVQLFAKES